MSRRTDGTQHPNLIVGVFSTLIDAESAVEQLKRRGLSTDDVTVISSNDVVRQYFKEYCPDVDPEDWKSAAVLGGSTGAVLAGLTSVAALVTGAGIPVVVAGGLASFITGGIVGGLAGAMTERGFETEAADYYELAVADGKTLVAVDLVDAGDPQVKRAEITRVFESCGVEPMALHKNPDFAAK
jgi:hypothetical protein